MAVFFKLLGCLGWKLRFDYLSEVSKIISSNKLRIQNGRLACCAFEAHEQRIDEILIHKLPIRFGEIPRNVELLLSC